MGSGASTAEAKLKEASVDDVATVLKELSAEDREKLASALKAAPPAAKDTKAPLDAAWTELEEMIGKQPELVEETNEMMSAPPMLEECEAVLCKLCKVDGANHAAAKALWKADDPPGMGAALLASLKKIDPAANATDIKAALDPLVAEGKLGKLGAASMLFGCIGKWLEALHAHCAAAVPPAAKDTKAPLDAAWTKLKEMIEKQPELVEETNEMMSAPPLVEECEAVLCKLCKVDGANHAAAKALWKGDDASGMATALLASLTKIDPETDAKDIQAALDPLVTEGKLGKLGAASMLFGGIGGWLEALHSHCAEKA